LPLLKFQPSYNQVHLVG